MSKAELKELAAKEQAAKTGTPEVTGTVTGSTPEQTITDQKAGTPEVTGTVTGSTPEQTITDQKAETPDPAKQPDPPPAATETVVDVVKLIKEGTEAKIAEVKKGEAYLKIDTNIFKEAKDINRCLETKLPKDQLLEKLDTIFSIEGKLSTAADEDDREDAEVSYAQILLWRKDQEDLVSKVGEDLPTETKLAILAVPVIVEANKAEAEAIAADLLESKKRHAAIKFEVLKLAYDENTAKIIVSLGSSVKKPAVKKADDEGNTTENCDLILIEVNGKTFTNIGNEKSGAQLITDAAIEAGINFANLAKEFPSCVNKKGEYVFKPFEIKLQKNGKMGIATGGIPGISRELLKLKPNVKIYIKNVENSAKDSETIETVKVKLNAKGEEVSTQLMAK